MVERGTSIRARVRAELTEEIKKAARGQLAAEGANLSLRAVARELGMASSAVYRYFASRDELLTALIIDAYNALGAAAEAADAQHRRRTDFAGRWVAVARALREWALAAPSEYALVLGSPVPGYRAPLDTTGPASRTPFVLVGIVREAHAAGQLAPATAAPLPARLRAELAALARTVEVDLDEPILASTLLAWSQLYGAISFELFGQLNNMIDRRTEWFDYQARTMAAQIGLR
ncbi:TetR family transcriptional regulator [Actinocatenispora thailandica]|uniref:TetR family transcriptional regulator n=1 Tax=Actinocatenispora thailandica TaxID=227318 RepID=A0A7R7DPK3_9ACTN|nr:TetR/AcrR family transcriptional regulator [Actinocatenispora thailandica]BCJ35177.1 TetR family transcriptional regulator [Actinocatenispora thailandica]